MNELEKITKVVDRFMSLTTQDLPDVFAIDLALEIGSYQIRNNHHLDLDTMLTTEDVFSFKHDVVGIWNRDCFTPRFTKH